MKRKYTNIKKCYLHDEITQDVCSYGMGSIYLLGAGTWKNKFISSIGKINPSLTIIIPDGEKKEIKEEDYKWMSDAMNVSSCICFWLEKEDMISLINFGLWLKADRFFYGRDEVAAKNSSYLDWLYYKEQKLIPSNTIDELVVKVLEWMRS